MEKRKRNNYVSKRGKITLGSCVRLALGSCVIKPCKWNQKFT